MKDTFFKLNKDKQQNLINACLKEFANYNYTSSSINRIIKIAGISKGALFKYIHNKCDLYVFIMSGIMESVIFHQASHIDDSETCYFERIDTLLNSGFDYYQNNPLSFRVMLNGFYDLTSPIYNEITIKRKELIKKYQLNLLKGIDWDQYDRNKEEVLKISEYLIEGFNVTLLKKITKEINLEGFKILIKEDIEILISTLKKGLKGGGLC